MHNKPSRFPPFVLGLILGILCMIYLPKYVQPYLPESIAGKETVLKGTVLVKEKKGDALLLTVSTPEGALLATFKQKTREVDLLIKEKDEVQFTLPNYTPFIDNPKIIRVVKEQPAVPVPVEAPAAPAPAIPLVKNAKETKSRHHVKQQAAAPAPKSAWEAKPLAATLSPETEMEVKRTGQEDSAPPSGDRKTEQ
jgi:hypothetical protein